MPKKEFDLCKHLPYQIEENWIESVKKDFATKLQAENLNGIADCFGNLRLYLDCRYKLELKDRVWFAKIFYEMSCSKVLKIDMSKQFSDFCVVLIRDEDEMPTDALDLEWRPLYETIYEAMYPKHGRTYQSIANSISALTKLISHASRFFKNNSAHEILEEILPKLNVHDLTNWSHDLALLTIFLPTDQVPPPVKDVNYNGFYWVPTLFNLWGRVVNSSTLDMLFFDLFSRLAKSQVSNPESIGWSATHISSVYALGTRMLNLPVGSGSSGLESLPLPQNRSKGLSEYGVMDYNVALASYFTTSKTKSFARFIVYTIFPGDSVGSLHCFEVFIRAIETFAHPSNSGKWSETIAKICLEISEFLFERYQLEKEENSTVPQKYRMASEQIERVTICLDQILQMTLFGKDSAAVTSSQQAFRYLTWLNPRGIFPSLLAKIYPSLEGLTETHRTLSCLGVICNTATPLLRYENYPEGGQSLVSILHLLIPGLDVNDTQKSIVALMSLITLLVNVPLINTSRHPAEESEERQLCRTSSVEFESWVALFFERIFSIFENLPQNFGVGSRINVEENLLHMIYVTCEVVFEQLSDEFQDLAIAMIFKKAQTTITPTATEAIGVLCGLIPAEKRLAKFLPLCISRIEEEIENGAGSTPTGNRFVSNTNPFDFAKMSDASLHWFQSILMNIVGQSGVALLKYREEVEKVIELTVTKCLSKRGYLWAGYLIRMVLESLSTIYPLDYKSQNAKIWNDADFKRNASQRWGQKVDYDDLEISWHVPSEAEIAFATDLAAKYLQYTESGLESLIKLARESPSKVSGSEFRRLIAHLSNCIVGTYSFLQPTNEFDHDNYGEYTATYTPQKKLIYLNGGFLFNNPADPKYAFWHEKFERIGNLLLNSLRFFANERPDDIDTIKVLVSCVQSHLADNGMFDFHQWMYKFYKNLFKTGNDDSVLPRLHLIKSIHKIHYRRVQHSRKTFPTTKVVRDILESLFDLSLSKFSEVRKSAQSSLFASLKYHRSWRFDIFNKTMSVFKETDPVRDIDRIKGALYILRDRNSIMGVYTYYWVFTGKFIDALLSLQAEEKPTILELVRRIFLDFTKIFTPVQIEVNIPDRIKAITLSVSTIRETVDSLKAEQKRKEVISFEAQSQIHASLIEKVSKKINWKFLTMAIVIFDLILSPSLPFSADFMKLVFSWIIDEHPSIRVSCNALLCHLMDTMKDRAKAAGTSAMARIKRRFEQGTAAYNLALASVQNFDKSTSNCEIFTDKPMSWLIYPKILTGYEGSVPDGILPYEDKESAKGQQLMMERFSSEAFWDSWLGFAAMESPRDGFSKTTAGFYKLIFGLTQDASLEFLYPKLQKLVEDVKENSSQRAASEIIAGILRGSKHWNLSKKAKWESKIAELLFTGINASSMETIRHWLACLRYAFDSRDCKRFGIIVKKILDMKLDLNNPSFLAESKKLWLKDQLLRSFSYQLCNQVDGLLNSYSSIIVTPYQLVRDSVGRSLDNCLQLSHKETFKIFDDFLINCILNFNTFETAQLSPHESITLMFKKLADYRAAAHIGDPLSEYALSSKTFLSWFASALTSYQTYGIASYLKDMVLNILEMQDYSDQDLANMAVQVLKIYPNFLQDPIQLEGILHTLSDLCQCQNATSESKWHVKTRILPVIQVLYFRHLYLLSAKSKREVMDLLYILIRDPQVEVRKLASITLSGLVQCSERKEIDSMISRFRKLISESHLPKRKTSEPVTPTYSDLLGKRHAGILGLCSLVLAFPYDVPEWMPNILVELAQSASNPSPISNSITFTFGEFKRTHQDSWEHDQKKFNEDQMYTISDLIYSPGYYA